jgi:7-cyano-7-deazaguanine synthase
VEKARKIAAQAGVPITVREVNFIGEISSGCSLIDPNVKMDPVKPEKTMPNTFVPGRNLFFLSIAAVQAREIGAKNIITGVSQTDFSGYPDCRDSFIRSLNVTINLAMDEQFLIHTPLMWLNKAQTWKLADELGVFDLVRNETLTCYNGIPGDGCGNCPACQLRMKGLQEYLESKNSQL